MAATPVIAYAPLTMLLSGMIQSSAVAAVISDPKIPDNPIVECNFAFSELVGYRREEIIGRNCRFLTGPDTEEHLTERLREGIRQQRPTMVEILNYKKNGARFRNAVLVAPIFGPDGGLDYFLGSQAELSEGSSLDGMRREAAARIGRLTRRQREVALNIAAGKLNKQIAFELNLNERTVKMHRTALLRALGLRTTAEIIRLAIEAGY